MNSATGLIELKKPVDFEGLSPNPIPLRVIAVDGGAVARTATLAVDVVVTDVNDNVPVCTQAAYALEMAENVTVGFTVSIQLFTENHNTCSVWFHILKTPNTLIHCTRVRDVGVVLYIS